MALSKLDALTMSSQVLTAQKLMYCLREKSTQLRQCWKMPELMEEHLPEPGAGPMNPTWLVMRPKCVLTVTNRQQLSVRTKISRFFKPATITQATSTALTSSRQRRTNTPLMETTGLQWTQQPTGGTRHRKWYHTKPNHQGCVQSQKQCAPFSTVSS